MTKLKKIEVQSVQVGISEYNGEDYICITDMAQAKSDASRAADVIKNWIRTRTTLEFIGTWEKFTTPILKWSNLTTLKPKRGYLLLY